MIQAELVSYDDTPTLKPIDGVNAFNEFANDIFRQAMHNDDSFKSFILATEIPDVKLRLASIVVGMALDELHPINKFVLPVLNTLYKEFEVNVIHYEDSMLDLVPEQGHARQSRFKTSKMTGKMDRYGKGHFITSDVKNTAYGRKEIINALLRISIMAKKTFAMVGLKYLIMCGNQSSLHAFHIESRISDEYRYKDMIMRSIENFCVANKTSNGILQVVDYNKKAIEEASAGVSPDFLIIPSSKVALLLKSNPLFTRYKEGGDDAPDLLKSPLSPTYEINGIRLMSAPDFSYIDDNLDNISLKQRYVIGRYEPIELFPQMNRYSIPTVKIFDINKSDYVSVSLETAIVNCQCFVPAGGDKWAFNFDLFKVIHPPIVDGQAPIQSTFRDSNLENNPFFYKTDNGTYKFVKWLFNGFKLENLIRPLNDADAIAFQNKVLVWMDAILPTGIDPIPEVQVADPQPPNYAGMDSIQAQQHRDNYERDLARHNTYIDLLHNNGKRMFRKLKEHPRDYFKILIDRENEIFTTGTPSIGRRIDTIEGWCTNPKTNEMDWLSALMFRPYDQGYTNMGIMCKGGKDLGFVAHSTQTIETGNDPTTSTNTLDYRIWIGAMVTNPTLLRRIDHIFYAGISYGGGTKMIDKDTNNTLKESLEIGSLHDACMYSIVYPTYRFDNTTKTYKKHFEAGEPIIHLKGKSNCRNIEAASLEYPCSHFYSHLYGFDKIDTHLFGTPDQHSVARYVCPGSYKYYSSSGVEISTKGRTHHGPEENVYSKGIRMDGIGIASNFSQN